MTTAKQQLLTVAEYLELEATAATKHEYVNDEIVAMAGASPEHEVVKSGLDRAIGRALDAAGKRCLTFLSDTRVRIDETGLYAYPDLTVVCDRPEFTSNENPPSLLNPQVIFEILSPSTAEYDQGVKRAHYRRRASLQEYVLVSSPARQIIVERRGDDGWWASRVFEGADTVPIASLGISISMDRVYAQLELLEEAARSG